MSTKASETGTPLTRGVDDDSVTQSAEDTAADVLGDDISQPSSISEQDAEKALHAFHPNKYHIVLGLDPAKLSFQGAVQIDGLLDGVR